MPHVTVTYKTPSGQTLVCEYGYRVIPGKYHAMPEDCYPDEYDVSEPTYTLDGEELEFIEIPDELQDIADVMFYNSDDARFTVHETNE